MHLYGSFAKVDVEQRTVWGYASTSAVDAHGEIVTTAAIEEALDAYLLFPAVRQMHQLDAVGKTIEASVDDKGLYVGAKIVDDVAWGKITEGVFSGFSIGGRVLARDPDDRKIITKILLNEISLVDRPSNPDAKFDVWKAAGLHSSDDVDTADQLAKVVSERDDLRKALAAKDDELNKMATRVVSTIENLATSNADLRKRNAILMTRVAPAVVPQIRKQLATGGADHTNVFERVEKTLAELELSMPQLERGVAALEAMAERRDAPARAWGRNDA